MELVIQNNPQNISVVNNNEQFFVDNNIEIMEQNLAFQHIDETFKQEEFMPYKKSIKNNSKGKYIELAFITPSIGKRYKELIKKLTEEIGWSLCISNSVNQNEIINLAIRLSMEKRIILKKTPSFNLASLKVVLKVESANEELLKEIKHDFQYKTGCSLEWV